MHAKQSFPFHKHLFFCSFVTDTLFFCLFKSLPQCMGSSQSGMVRIWPKEVLSVVVNMISFSLLQMKCVSLPFLLLQHLRCLANQTISHCASTWISHPLLVLINQPSVCLVSAGYFKTHQGVSHLCHKRGQSFLLCKDKRSLSLTLSLYFPHVHHW